MGEFYYTVEYKSGRMHLQADHLLRLTEHVEVEPVDDRLVNDNIFMITVKPKWYAGIVEFMTTQKLPENWSREEKRKVRINSRHFLVMGNRLFRRGVDVILRRCVSKTEVESILIACNDSACGGYFLDNLQGKRF